MLQPFGSRADSVLDTVKIGTVPDVCCQRPLGVTGASCFVNLEFDGHNVFATGESANLP
ncbi:hypothetical protein SAMN05444164_3848 [Bradyrhizobium erythrophlei]|uniref:Uncharacterized protein n=1 Tax=Bradyrhizobium erythrophlei TaxID=1437360 RepID=A0A1H4YA45_9BRAD|nr:hypothetical protein SAMN05444164_3848 [Bradyrhizobium erythrophlei]